MTELQKRETALKKSLRLLYVYAIAAGAIFCYIGYYDTFFISYCGPSTFLAFALMMLAILPIALRMVYQVCGAVQIPVVGLGGISSWQDAAAFLMAGATAVQVGTANFVKPDICLDIINGLEQFLKDQGCRSVDEIIGAARV